MNAHESHGAYDALLMEYLDGDLDAEKSATFVVHLMQCDECSAQLQMARTLEQHFGALRDTPSNLFDTPCEQKNFDRLWQRIEIQNQRKQTISMQQRKWLPYAAALAATLFIAIGTSWFERAQQPDYRTLAQTLPRSACGELHVRFADNFSAADIQTVLTALQVEIVAGPTAHGIYTLRAPAATNALTRLRLHPAVVLVEPVSC